MKRYKLRLKRPLIKSKKLWLKFSVGNFSFAGAVGAAKPVVRNIKKVYENKEL